ncbi:hypothetical protein B0H16DRAFT_1468074 [Mycena metata]|uniref:Uncharacterized protein n=1 Tax=Mycena metata TaxID=1033252 RepID=A0AAD7I2D0_9AGAR|nr:hypothetical protein B0H16DRAFT_1468074 [Mycena metata]
MISGHVEQEAGLSVASHFGRPTGPVVSSLIFYSVEYGLLNGVIGPVPVANFGAAYPFIMLIYLQKSSSIQLLGHAMLLVTGSRSPEDDPDVDITAVDALEGIGGPRDGLIKGKGVRQIPRAEMMIYQSLRIMLRSQIEIPGLSALPRDSPARQIGSRLSSYVTRALCGVVNAFRMAALCAYVNYKKNCGQIRPRNMRGFLLSCCFNAVLLSCWLLLTLWITNESISAPPDIWNQDTLALPPAACFRISVCFGGSYDLTFKESSRRFNKN